MLGDFEGVSFLMIKGRYGHDMKMLVNQETVLGLKPRTACLNSLHVTPKALKEGPTGKGNSYMGWQCIQGLPSTCLSISTFLNWEEGDLGPIYGFQWRHFGARYIDMHADYTGQGFDQLLDVINKIKNNPDDRRIILSAWNPSDLKLMALPPCHMFAQFYVANGEQMDQGSADMGLGVPFNIASYSLLTCMIAHVCGMHFNLVRIPVQIYTSFWTPAYAIDDSMCRQRKCLKLYFILYRPVPGDFIHVTGDSHVYRTHIRPLQEQLQKLPKPFAILKINPQKKNIDSFVAADFQLIGYDPHQKIEMKMVV
ncbi:Bifunctional dihydrofolate reductase-thymidylate synthase 2 [Vitis vinifera]|uniref:thymidylate synthase n=1 Tax=Vitis vinifera TaxID=29760 RepID=A0A438CI78_VITVI|nr:Bifunctional dihydrofolate reductase-thymidylate synthase 2 [Vitis vinifera]